MKLNTGLVYSSLVKPDDVGLYPQLVNLVTIQSEMLRGELSGIDDSNIQILSNASVTDNPDSDEIFGSSFLSVVTVDPTSMFTSQIGEVFEDLIPGENGVVIKEVTPQNYFICVRPGTSINPKTKEVIKQIILKTSTVPQINDTIDFSLSQVETDELSAEVSPEMTTPVSIHPELVVPEGTPQQPKSEIGGEVSVDKDKLVEEITALVITKLRDELSELGDILMDIRKNKTEIIDIVTSSAIQAVNKKVDAMTVTPTNTSATEPSQAIAGTESTNSIIETINAAQDNKPVTNIYDTVESLKNLVGGCESDEELFDKILEKKDSIAPEVLNTVSQWNMYNYLVLDDMDALSGRKSFERRLALGLQ